MKVTVCELPDNKREFEEAWKRLIGHIADHNSILLLLPEMPFYPWVASRKEVENDEWEYSVEVHNRWIERFKECPADVIAGTRPVIDKGIRKNMAFVWEPESGIQDIHAKYYLPDEPGYYEATWYSRGNGNFSAYDTAAGKIGFMICTELWFTEHARNYGKQGVQLLLCPRATPRSSVKKWIAGGQTAAVVSGAFCLSSNLAGRTENNDFAGTGWIIEPEEGQILGLTSGENPFLTIDIDIQVSERAKSTYPRYVEE